jgi:hypothetical protein
MDMHDTPPAAIHLVGAESEATPVGFAHGVWHPEDLVRLEGTPWIVVSAMRSMRGKGAILAVRADARAPAMELEWSQAAESGRHGTALFDPHGIDVRPLGNGRFELLVVDHGGGEAIDRLIVDASGEYPRIVEGRRIDKPLGTSGNAVAFLPDGGFVMTSMFDPRDANFIAKFAEAAPTGAVWRWQKQQGWSRIGPDLSGANGIAASPDGGMIYVSEWAARKVWKLSADGHVLARIDLDFLPDNLRWTRDSHLLLAGQIARPENLFGCEAHGTCPLGFAVVSIDPETMALRPMLRVLHEQALSIGFGGATGAIQMDEELWVASFTGERLARYRLP